MAGYNVQITVDTAHHLIVVHEVTYNFNRAGVKPLMAAIAA